MLEQISDFPYSWVAVCGGSPFFFCVCYFRSFHPGSFFFKLNLHILYEFLRAVIFCAFRRIKVSSVCFRFGVNGSECVW